MLAKVGNEYAGKIGNICRDMDIIVKWAGRTPHDRTVKKLRAEYQRPSGFLDLEIK